MYLLHTQVSQKEASLWSKRWIFQLFLVLIAYVRVFSFFIQILNFHGNCDIGGNQSQLFATERVMTLPSPLATGSYPLSCVSAGTRQTPLFRELNQQKQASCSDFFAELASLLWVPELARWRIRQVPVLTQGKATGAGLSWYAKSHPSTAQSLRNTRGPWLALCPPCGARSSLPSPSSELSSCCMGPSPFWFSFSWKLEQRGHRCAWTSPQSVVSICF